jgi:hypothetical protein
MEDPMPKNACIAAATLTIASLSLFAAIPFVAGRAMPAGPTASTQLINPFELMQRVSDMPTQVIEDFSTVY